jgi:hypothetical protein
VAERKKRKDRLANRTYPHHDCFFLKLNALRKMQLNINHGACFSSKHICNIDYCYVHGIQSSLAFVQLVKKLLIFNGNWISVSYRHVFQCVNVYSLSATIMDVKAQEDAMCEYQFDNFTQQGTRTQEARRRPATTANSYRVKVKCKVRPRKGHEGPEEK